MRLKQRYEQKVNYEMLLPMARMIDSYTYVRIGGREGKVIMDAVK